MEKVTIGGLRELLRKQGEKEKLELVPPSSVVSWLYPGQFAFCLNEEFIWDRYGSFIDMKGEEHFHKIQPVIRWVDFTEFFMGEKGGPPEKSDSHLAHFDMVTIGGGHIIPKKDYKDYSPKIYGEMFNFLINELGLKKENFIITYFPGGKLSAFAKNTKGKPKFRFDHTFPEDLESKQKLFELGFTKTQIKKDFSRRCFLIPDWVCGEIAPWGYRNEINYRAKNGLVDIATIERLTWRPVYENREITSIKKWDKSFIIAGAGFERLVMIANNLEKIQEVENIKTLYDFIKSNENGNPRLVTESLRLVHRIVADTNGDLRDSRSLNKPSGRIEKFNKLKRNLLNLGGLKLKKALEINARINPWHPKLKESISKTIEIIKDYAESQKDWKQLKREKQFKK